jgi:transcriptional regulator with XRE-family HTH domain
MKFPNLLWALREKKIAQYELAARIGISESKLSRAINGRVQLSADERRRIGDAVGYSPSWLFRAMTPSRVEQGTE